MTIYTYRGTGEDRIVGKPRGIRPPAKCGTDGGYYRHLRTTKTEPCQACKTAHADAVTPERRERLNAARRRLRALRAAQRLSEAS